MDGNPTGKKMFKRLKDLKNEIIKAQTYEEEKNEILNETNMLLHIELSDKLRNNSNSNST